MNRKMKDETHWEHMSKKLAFAKKCVDSDGLEAGLTIFFDIENEGLNILFPNRMTTAEASAAIVAAADRYIAVRDSALQSDVDLTKEDVHEKLGGYIREGNMSLDEAMRYVAVLRVLYEYLGNPEESILSESDIEEELSYMLCVHPEKTAEEHLDDLVDGLEPEKLNGFMRFAENARFMDEMMNGTDLDRMFWYEKIYTHCASREAIVINSAVIYHEIASNPDGELPADIDPAVVTVLMAAKMDAAQVEMAHSAGHVVKAAYERFKRLLPYILAVVLLLVVFLCFNEVLALGVSGLAKDAAFSFGMHHPGLFGITNLLQATELANRLADYAQIFSVLAVSSVSASLFISVRDRVKAHFAATGLFDQAETEANAPVFEKDPVYA